ncbi:MAG: LysR family transcriptional regulator [Hyphomicrobiales bacterium]|nr:LysR family transcriptional regulator [Hyphomicrobiales bacterium]
MAPNLSKIDIVAHFANGGRLTPEDFELIEAIRKHRSIIGAGRATGISYRKCWLMVDALNRTFETPVIATHPGRKQTGSEITPFGERLVALYRSMERRSRSGAAAAMKELEDALNPRYRARASGAASEHQKLAARRPRSRRS